MPITVSGSTLTFNDSTTMTTAANPTASGDYVRTAYTSPATWTKPASLKAVKVTVVGAGGNGGSGGPASASGGGGGGAAIFYAVAANIPGPQPVTAGPGTNSFGTFASATAGAAGGTSGLTTANGGVGTAPTGQVINGAPSLVPGGLTNGNYGGPGGSSILGQGGRGAVQPAPAAALAGTGYGGGGGGGQNTAGGTPAGAAGTNGIVIVEEFY